MPKVPRHQLLLVKKYNELIKKMGLDLNYRYSNINVYVKSILRDFMQKHNRVAIYCYGVHTQMLMADFVSELRDAVCIVDNGNVKKDSSFEIIKDGEIESYDIDGVIISSYRFKEEIKKNLHMNHKEVEVLDIYEELEKKGIILEKEFYSEGPYQIYTRINTLYISLKDTKGNNIRILKQILEELISIKDFRLASELAKRIYSISKDNQDKEILEIIQNIYELEIKAVLSSGKNNILLLCFDGMRRIDFYDEKKLKKTLAILKKDSYLYKNAYSYSTMTFESLVPVFSGNTDQKTKYFLSDEVDSNNCRFMKKAVEENRFIAVYGDGNHYIYDESIKYSGKSQTITEKLWDFVIDLGGVDNGIFYLHELYESHYSFPNPYTDEKIVSNGSAMLFDYLQQNAGKLRTNYKKQQEDALKYLDDTIAPFIEVLPCNLVLFADHGNLVLEPATKLMDVKKQQFVAAEEWIQIPLVIKTNSGEIGEDNELISLMEMNNIILTILNNVKYEYKPKEFIKIGRSEIYNQQFKELYHIRSCGYNGEAFEGFIFRNGYKLIVYSNGIKELYVCETDARINDENKIEELFEIIKNDITILDK